MTNDTDGIVWDIQLVVALLDENDEVLFVAEDCLYNFDLMPGGSGVYRTEISSAFKRLYEMNGLVPARAEAIAYVLKFF